MKFKTLLTATVLSFAAMSALSSPANALDQAQKDEIGQVVREYLLAHPELMVEVQEALAKKQAEARTVQVKNTLKNNHDEIFNASHDYALGNPNGKITIVEFFDYNCGYCKRAFNDMDTIIKSNPDVRFVLKEFPILGPDSLAAHKVSYAFRLLAPEKYGEFHSQLLLGKHANEARAVEIATSLGVKEEDLRKKMAEQPNDDNVRQAYELATKLGITGTPSYVIGDEAIFGAVGAEELSGKIASVGQCGKTVC